MNDSLQAILDEYGVAVLDGGLATELERRGLELDDPLWSALALLEHPETLVDVHLDYFRAGADVAIGASYQASVEGFVARGIHRKQAVDLLQESVRLVQRARERFRDTPAASSRPCPLVAASIGCYGAVLHDGSEYRGHYGLSRRELMAFHDERLQVLIDAGPDLLACETLPCRIEAEALVELLERQSAANRLPAWLSFACRDGERVAEGQAFAECVTVAERSRAIVAVGVNCTAPHHVERLLRIGADHTSKPLVAYPNSGEVWDPAGHSWRSAATSVSIPDAAPDWRAAGARLIGGCCRTTPDTIRGIARALGRR